MVGRGTGGLDGVRHGGSNIRFNRNICMTSYGERYNQTMRTGHPQGHDEGHR